MITRSSLVRPLFIAEVKTRSPFGYVSPHNRITLLDRARTLGDMVSIHTDERWGGSLGAIGQARAFLNGHKPILAKGIHPTDDDLRRAFDAGADYALVVGRVPADDLVDRCLIEPTDMDQLYRDCRTQHQVVWNARDLATGKPKTRSFAEARSIHLNWLCQASLIRSWADVHPGANAILVGEHLMSFPLP